MAMEPQEAIEEAALRTIRSASGEFRYSTDNSGCMFDGEPPPACGNVWVSVWSDNSRRSQGKTCLDEIFSLQVTITLRSSQLPWDAWRLLRRELERRANRVRAALHADCYDSRVARLASALMAADGSGQKVGFRDHLAFERMDGARRVGPDWFKADLDRVSAADSGIAQTLSFGGLRLIQALATME